MKKGAAANAALQRLLTGDEVALNPSCRGLEGQLVRNVSPLRVQAITGKPYKPTARGMNQQFHQTLFRWLGKQPLAATHQEPPNQVDRLDQVNNTERPHQGLPGASPHNKRGMPQILPKRPDLSFQNAMQLNQGLLVLPSA